MNAGDLRGGPRRAPDRRQRERSEAAKRARDARRDRDSFPDTVSVYIDDAGAEIWEFTDDQTTADETPGAPSRRGP